MMTGLMKRLVVAGSLLALPGVSSAQEAVISASSAAESPDTSHAAIGITLSLRAPVVGSVDPDAVYFVRLDAGESLDSALARGQVITTNEASGGRLLLLGTIPGTYVAVAAVYRETQAGEFVPIATVHLAKNVTVTVGFDPFATEDVYRTYFARDVIESTMVTVGLDSFVYVGQLTVKQSTGIAKGDEVQKHFQQVLEGKAARQPGFLRALSGTYSYRGSLREIRRDRESEERFLEKAGKRLKNTEWAALLEKRRAELQGSPSTKP